MPEVSQYPPGTCCWLELTTLDPEMKRINLGFSTNLAPDSHAA
jgi:hypothetical protein